MINLTSSSKIKLKDLNKFIELKTPININKFKTYYNWLYCRNPYKAENTSFYVIKKGDIIVGCIGAFLSKIRVNGKLTQCAFGTDYYVDPNYLGLPSLKLIKKLHSEYDINIGARVSKSAFKLFSKMNYFNLSREVKFAVFKNHNLKYLYKDFRYSVKLLCTLPYRFYAKNINLKRYKINIDFILPENYNLLWTEASKSLSVTIEKDYQYLKWRYEDCPLKEYLFLSLIENHTGKLTGISVIEVNKEKKYILIEDVVVIRNKKNIESLIQSIINFFIDNNISFIYSHLMDSEIERYLSNLGFVLYESDLSFMVKCKNIKEQESVYNGKVWSFFGGNVDRF